MVEKEPAKEDIRPELTVLVLLRDQLQKLRIMESNRQGMALKNDEEGRARIHGNYAEQIHKLENEVTKTVQDEVRQHPAWPWLDKIRGVGETSAAMVLGQIPDIARSPTVSSLVRYAGFAVFDGKRERPVKGEKLHYNPRLKTMMYRLIDLQIKTRGPFRRRYDEAKHRYLTTKGPTEYGGLGEWTLGHCELAARRKAAVLFLSMLWEVWRDAIGLPISRGPWIKEYGGEGHTIENPWEYIKQGIE